MRPSPRANLRQREVLPIRRNIATDCGRAPTPDEWVWQKKILDGDLTETLKIYPDIERADADASFDQMLTAQPLQPMPLVVLSADRPWGPLVPGMIATACLPPTRRPTSATSPTVPRRLLSESRRARARLETRDEDRQRSPDPPRQSATRHRLHSRSRRRRTRRQDRPGAVKGSVIPRLSS